MARRIFQYHQRPFGPAPGFACKATSMAAAGSASAGCMGAVGCQDTTQKSQSFCRSLTPDSNLYHSIHSNPLSAVKQLIPLVVSGSAVMVAVEPRMGLNSGRITGRTWLAFFGSTWQRCSYHPCPPSARPAVPRMAWHDFGSGWR